MKYSLAAISVLSLFLIACPTGELSSVVGSGPGTDEDVRSLPDRSPDASSDAGVDLVEDTTTSADPLEAGVELADNGGFEDLGGEDLGREDTGVNPPDLGQPDEGALPDVSDAAGIADDEDVSDNAPPSAQITAPSDPIVIGESVEFSGEDSSDSDGSVVSYDWQFRLVGSPDIAENSGMRVTTSFDVWGTHEATLEVSDDEGAIDVAAHTFEVLSPPAAEIELPPGDIEAGVALSLSGSLSTDPDGEIVLYTWDLGDETSDTGETVTHTYPTIGLYHVTLVVTDDDELTDTVTTVLNVGDVNAPPEADAGPDRNAAPGESINFDAGGTLDDGEIVAYRWDFGDGEFAFTETTTHGWADTGTYTVTLTVEDDDGLLDDDTAEVVVNTPPVAVVTVLTTEPMAEEAVGFSAVDSYDPDGGALVAWEWEFGDGGTGTGVTPSHTFATEGDYTVRLTVRDAVGATGSVDQVVSIGAAGSGTIDGVWSIRAYDSDDLLEATCSSIGVIVGPATCELEQDGSSLTMRCGDAVYLGTRTGDSFVVDMRLLLISDPALLPWDDPDWDPFWVCGDIYVDDHMTGTFVSNDRFEGNFELSIRFEYEDFLFCPPCYYEPVPRTGRKL